MIWKRFKIFLSVPTGDRGVWSDLEVDESGRQDEDVYVLEPTQLPNTASTRVSKTDTLLNTSIVLKTGLIPTIYQSWMAHWYSCTRD